MEDPIIMDDLRGKPTIFGNTHFYVPILQQNYRPKMNAPFANEQPWCGQEQPCVYGKLTQTCVVLLLFFVAQPKKTQGKTKVTASILKGIAQNSISAPLLPTWWKLLNL